MCCASLQLAAQTLKKTTDTGVRGNPVGLGCVAVSGSPTAVRVASW